MSAVHRFVASRTGTECRIDTRTHSCTFKLVIGSERSVLRVCVRPLDATELIVEKIVIDDTHHLIEYPVQVLLSGICCVSKPTRLHSSSLVKRGIVPYARLSQFETYLVLLEGVRYKFPIQGWIHYKVASN